MMHLCRRFSSPTPEGRISFCISKASFVSEKQILAQGLANVGMDALDWNDYILERRILVAMLASLGWDFILSFRQEVELLHLRKLTYPMLTHYSSRLATLIFAFSGFALGFLPANNCGALRDTLGVLFVIAEATTSLQFLHRVRAVFYGETKIITCFVILWLAVVGTSLVIPFTTDVGHMGTTQYCDLRIRTHFVPLSIVVTAFMFYTLVFFAISWRLVRTMDPDLAAGDDSRTTLSLRLKRFRSIFRGDNLPALSKALLRGGRMYYLHTLGLDLLIASVVSNGFSSLSYTNMMFALLYIEVTLKNIFACRLFRDTVLMELVTDPEMDSRTSEGIVFATSSLPRTAGGISGVMVSVCGNKAVTEVKSIDINDYVHWDV